MNENRQPISTDSKLLINIDQQEHYSDNQINYTFSDGFLDIDYGNASNFKFILSSKQQSQEQSFQKQKSSSSSEKRGSLFYNRIYEKSQQQSPIAKDKGQRIFQYFFRFAKVKNFIAKLNKYIVPKINRIQFDLIADSTSNYNNFQKHHTTDKNFLNRLKTFKNSPMKFVNFASNIFRKISSSKSFMNLLIILENIPIINPQNNLVVFWNIILTGIRIYFLFLIPIEMAFQNNLLFQGLFGITLIFEIFLIIDFILRFNTVYFDEGKAVTNRKQIFLKQLNLNTVTDMIAILPLVAFNSNEQIGLGFSLKLSQLILVFFLFQNRHVQRVVSQWQNDLSKNYSSLLELLKLIISVWYLIHLFACIWFFIGIYQEKLGNSANWLQQANCVDFSTFDQYLISFYFSSVTLFTVGYGDIYPQNYVERIFCILYMMITSIQFSYSLNTVGSIIMELKLNGEEMKKKLRIINNYMSLQNISGSLQYEIRQYLNFIWNQDQNQNFEEEAQIIQLLPNKLKDELMHEANQIFFKKCHYFRDNFDQNFKNKLVKHLKQIRILPGNYIDKITLNTKDSRYFCFIKFGQVEVIEIYNENGPKETRAFLKQNESFNFNQFLLNIETKEKFKCVEFTELFVLEFSDFFEVLKDNSVEYERFLMFIEDLQEDKFLSFEKVCKGCQQKFHTISNCPQMHYICDKDKIIKSFAFQNEQVRKKTNRNLNRQYRNTRCQKSILIEILQYYQEQNEAYGQLYFSEDQLGDAPYQKYNNSNGNLNEQVSESSENDSDSSSLISPLNFAKQAHQSQSLDPRVSYLRYRQSLNSIQTAKVFSTRHQAINNNITQTNQEPDLCIKLEMGKIIENPKITQRNNQEKSNFIKISNLNYILNEDSKKKQSIISHYGFLIELLEGKLRCIRSVQEDLKFKNSIQNEIEMEILRLKKNLELQQENSSENLLTDLRRDFKVFKPQNNFENVLKQMNNRSETKQSEIFRLLLPYHKYPQDYILKYMKSVQIPMNLQKQKFNLRRVAPLPFVASNINQRVSK